MVMSAKESAEQSAVELERLRQEYLATGKITQEQAEQAIAKCGGCGKKDPIKPPTIRPTKVVSAGKPRIDRSQMAKTIRVSKVKRS